MLIASTLIMQSAMIEGIGTYKTRCGERAEVIWLGVFFAHGSLPRWKIKLQWKMNGQVLPSGGQSPFDIIERITA